MDIIIQVFTTIIAVVAALVGVISYFLSKKQLYTQTVTVQRIEWINTVRTLLSDFIEAYVDGQDLKKALSIKAHIDLFLNMKNPDHEKFSIELNNCIKTFGTNEIELTALTDAAQLVFKNAWERMKWEAGFKLSQEKQIQNKLTEKIT